MKRSTNKIVAAIILAMHTLNACNESSQQEVNSNAPYYQFATATEAVAKGKKDLLNIISSHKLKGIGIDSALLARAQPVESLNTIEISLDLLMKADSIEHMQDIVYKEKGRITPLYADDKIVTSIITRIDSGIWTVSGFRNEFVETEISVLRKSNPFYHQSEISLYEIPTIKARVYGFNFDGKEDYFTGYNGFSLEKPVALNRLFEVLKREVRK